MSDTFSFTVRGYSMNYEHVWKVLEQLILDLRRKGVTVSPELVDDLKSAQTYINIAKTDPTALDIVTDIELYLEKVESNVMYLAQTDVSDSYATEWLRRVSEARATGLDEAPPEKPKFVSGVPKGDHWVRLQVSDLIPEVDLNPLINQFNLSTIPQDNGYLLVHGKTEDVKAFLKEITSKISKKRTAP
jgi:hypothetical protein